jgi:hypothetical protein
VFADNEGNYCFLRVAREAAVFVPPQSTIANVGSGTNAQSFFVIGDAERAAGHFKAAYAAYQTAYRAAAK